MARHTIPSSSKQGQVLSRPGRRLFLMLSSMKVQCKSPRALPAPLTRDYLQRVPSGYYSKQEYLARDENFERIPLGLRTSRMAGKAMIDDFETQWKRTSAGAASVNYNAQR